MRIQRPSPDGWPVRKPLAAERVLTISDNDAFCIDGGIVQLVLSGNRVRFRINQANAQAHGLKLSSQLLKMAEIVGPAPGEDVRR